MKVKHSVTNFQIYIPVILPQLSALSMHMSQMMNQTRKVDMALALIEALSNVIFSPVNKYGDNTVLIPGLQYVIHHTTLVCFSKQTFDFVGL